MSADSFCKIHNVCILCCKHQNGTSGAGKMVLLAGSKQRHLCCLQTKGELRAYCFSAVAVLI